MKTTEELKAMVNGEELSCKDARDNMMQLHNSLKAAIEDGDPVRIQASLLAMMQANTKLLWSNGYVSGIKYANPL